MRVLTVTNMYPTVANPQFGIFVKEQVQSIRALGHDVDVLFVNGRDGRVRHKGYVLGVPRLWHQLRRSEYDVVHAHYVLTGLVARCQWSMPLVLTHHGIEVQDGFQGRLCRWSRRFPDELIVVAPWMRDALGTPQAHVIPCGVDLSLFHSMSQIEARQVLGLDPSRRYVLFAGEWWRPEKRFHLVEAAVERVQRRHPDIELLKVDREAHWRVPLYMNAVDALALVSTCEGSPMVVKEAVACGLPVIATDAGDAWDVIDGIAGCYRVQPEIGEIAARLEEALSPPRRIDGTIAARSFSMDAIARDVVSVYQRAWRPSHGNQRAPVLGGEPVNFEKRA
ncbi:MAG: glycosyltransferase [Chloroflexota bacterium]|nr:glycosyltransferase [Chloroflexota bacterium]